MGNQTRTDTLDDLFLTTAAYRKSGAVDQAFMKLPMLDWLLSHGGITDKSVSGYSRIEIPVKYGKNEQTKWLGRGGTTSLTESEFLAEAWDDWKFIATPIIRYGQDDAKNRGAARVIDYVSEKLDAAETGFRETLNDALWGDGTGDGQPNGLQNIVSATPTLGTLHNISRVTYPWWRNQVKASTGASGTYLLSDMKNFMNTITKYSLSEKADQFLMTDQTSFELYEAEIDDKVTIINNTSKGDIGFDSLNFKGRPMFFDEGCPSGYMYFLNPKYLQLFKDSDGFMDMTEWDLMGNGHVGDKIAHLKGMCQLITSRPGALGVLTGISAT